MFDRKCSRMLKMGKCTNECLIHIKRVQKQKAHEMKTKTKIIFCQNENYFFITQKKITPYMLLGNFEGGKIFS